jgi:RNA polymerase sigma factor (sigma-70 family)
MHDDIALASACAAGDEEAWARLLRDYKPALLRAADALDPTGGARDLAEELFADLFSKQLFRYYQGRSSLATWLRAVLAQRYVDRVRAQGRFAGPADDSMPAVANESPPGEAACRACVRLALEGAIGALTPADRLLMRLYYSQGLKLAAIGRLRREHEATISRHLARVREALRVATEAGITRSVTETGMSLRECLRLVMTDAGDLDLDTLLARSADESVHNEGGTLGLSRC